MPDDMLSSPTQIRGRQEDPRTDLDCPTTTIPSDISESDLAQIWEWNQSVPLSIDKCVHDLVQERSEAQSFAPAVCAWDGELTYGELDRLASCLASRLIALGIDSRTNSIIPLCFEKSMWTTVAMLGVMKAGAAFVLLDASQPEQRLQTIVEQVRAKIIVSSPSKESLSLRLVQRVITLSSDYRNILHDGRHLTPRVVKPSSPVYVAFTSGSTGTPKGAVITHQNLASALHHQKEYMSLTSTSRFYDFSSYSFDAAIGTAFATLIGGGCVCVPNEIDRRDDFVQSILSLNANVIDLTPSVAKLLSPDQVPCLQTIFLGGEAVQVRDVEVWWGRVRIMSLYGPCECTPTTTINWDAQSPEEVTYLGKGVGLVTWIVDPENHDTLLPVGDVGELLLEGPPVGLGYLHDPERTAAVFIEDPVWLLRGSSNQPGRHGRLYKTGDLVRYREDGRLIFVARKDAQVKIRGQRIELGEIEHILRSHKFVENAVAVIQQETMSQGQMIACFVTVRNHRLEFEPSQQISLTPRMVDNEHGLMHNSTSTMLEHCSLGRERIGKWLDDSIDPLLIARDVGPSPLKGAASETIIFSLPTFDTSTSVFEEPYLSPEEFSTKTARSISKIRYQVDVLNTSEASSQFGTLESSGIVILKSMVHYVPGEDYLLSMVKDLLRLPGVRMLFFDDVRSHALYRQSMALRALNITGGKARKDEVQRVLENMELAVSDLLVDPVFFTALTERLPNQIEHVEIVPQNTHTSKETGIFRYAAAVHVTKPGASREYVYEIDPHRWIDFREHSLDRQSLLGLLLSDNPSDLVMICNIPHWETVFGQLLADFLRNQRYSATDSSDWIASAREQAQQQPSLSLSDLGELAIASGYRLELSWARQFSQRGGLDAIFHRYPLADGRRRTLFRFPTEDQQYQPHCSVSRQPMREDLRKGIEKQLLEALQAKLPSYMVPQFIEILEEMPLNNNCKVDRKLLEKSSHRGTIEKAVFQRPKTISPTESQMLEIWGKALNIEPNMIGFNDSFFQLGGDSIIAMKVVQDARKFGFNLTVPAIFRHPKLHEMAHLVDSTAIK
ncbi:non-ribosomal peptide synthetase protein [Seiridium cupressi]